MIFVTVGTHEQPFDRLIKKIDELVENQTITEEVFIQTGFSTYQPKYCKYENFISYDTMQHTIKEARVVITHGGPSSFLNVLQYNKNPIVIPRKLKYNEHVNDHQLRFLQEVVKKGYDIVIVENENELKGAILNYNNKAIKFLSNNNQFNNDFTRLVKKMIN